MPPSFQDLPPRLQADLTDHWEQTRPREAVGLVLNDGSTLPLKNWIKAVDKFAVGFWSVLWNLGWSTLRRGDGVMMVYHSHPQSSEPSPMDKNFMVVLARGQSPHLCP
jgi:proteasome lid subunit RPN8/RPN11